MFDLRGTLLKKQENETARLHDFEFRQRARATKLLAGRLGIETGTVAARIVQADNGAILSALAADTGLALTDLQRLHDRSVAEAHAQLVAELGDPTPYRLA